MDGVVALIKPPGISSNTAANIVKYIFDAKKAGHTGTLDIGAAGVLAVCLGGATKCVDALMDTDKRYIAEICFGVATNTQDAYGIACERAEGIVPRCAIESALPAFIGEIEQCTPLYSAAKQDGVPLYKLARRGAEVRQKLRSVVVRDIRLLSQTGENRWLMDVTCGKGTYIRTLCADIGRAVGSCAHMSFLLRTRTSGLDITEAHTMDELRAMKECGRLMDAIVPAESLCVQK